MHSADKVKLVTSQFKACVEKKYKVLDMKLFGSSARGDSSQGFDIDIMVKLPIVNREIEEDLFNIAYDLELEHDCVIDVIVFSKKMESNIPIYRNIKKEGTQV